MKTGGFLQRKTPLRARAPMKRSWMRRKPPRRIAKRLADRPYVRFVKALPCCVCGRPGPSDASHVTLSANQKGIGMKVPDDQVVPKCREHHRDWEQRRGRFAKWSREERWSQAAAWVAAVQLLATPETYEQALTFSELGLGTIEVGPGGAWSWWPATGGPMAWRAA